MIVDDNFNILHSSPRASRYLQHVPGAPSTDLLRAALPELTPSLHPALLRASRRREHVTTKPIVLDGPTGRTAVHMIVHPAAKRVGEHPVMLVTFLESDAIVSADDPGDGIEDDEREVLHGEIRRLQDTLDLSIDQSTLSDEALRASNEELQSINEELRSATEQLETSKEELQSLNEELTTVNFELKNKVDETSKINNDLNNLIASMDIATVFVDRDVNLQGFTPLASSLFNVLLTDIGRPLLDITHHLRYDRLTEDIREVMASLRPIEREVVDDRERWYLMRISPYRTTEDRINGAVINFIEVTEQRVAQRQLRATSERLRIVAESTPDYAIITLDVDGRVATWNRGAELTFGYTASEITGQHIRILFTADDRAAGQPERELAEARANGRALDERWHVRKDGTPVYCSGTTTLFSDGDITGFAKIARDLTERQLLDKQREEVLQAEKQVRQQLESAHKMRSEFLAVLSHELKNPLNLILMNVELLSRSPKATSDTRALNTIRRTVHAQSRIIDDLLDLSRLTTGKLTLDRTAIEWRPLLEHIIEAVRAQAEAKEQSLELEGENVTVYADAVRVEQIVWNLVTNAVKFTPKGGRITLRLTREDRYGVLAVRDTGRGIEPQHLDAVFDMFQQVGQSVATRNAVGLGIGLTLVRDLAEQHGGRVNAESAGPGMGSTFTVRLPLFERPAADEVRIAVIESPFRGKHVLLVDDDVDTLEVLSSLLESEGASVISTTRADQARELAAEGAFDLLLSDIAMPDVTGLDLIRELRRDPHTASLVAIAMSGFGRREDAERSRAAGFDAHLPKPLSMEALTKAWVRVSAARK